MSANSARFDKELEYLYNEIDTNANRKMHFSKQVLFAVIQYMICAHPYNATFENFTEWMNSIQVNRCITPLRRQSQ